MDTTRQQVSAIRTVIRHRFPEQLRGHRGEFTTVSDQINGVYLTLVAHTSGLSQEKRHPAGRALAGRSDEVFGEKRWAEVDRGKGS